MEESLQSVPMLDLKAQFGVIRKEVEAALTRVMESQHFVNGPDVAGLEEELARYCGVPHCVAMSSGTDALLAALMALEVGPGDEVITTPYTFFATVGVIARLGARPVFADIDPVTFNIDPAAVADLITPRTKVILPVHLFGQCAEMEPILKLAERHDLAVVEDAAQAIGGEYQGRRAGSMGTIGCFSFYPTKNLGGFGDGGAVVTNNPELADKLRLLREHGSRPRYFHQVLGGNFRLDSMQAAVLRIKLHHLDRWTQARQKNAAFYEAALYRAGLAGTLVRTPTVAQARHVFNQYVVRARDRDALRNSLGARKIACEVYYPLPMHLQPCLQFLGYRKGQFPESEKASAESLALPMFPELSIAQMQTVVSGVGAYYASAAGNARAA